ncbi:MAG: hypothetical protein ACO3GX_14590 [Gemmataceae bacterium]
MNKPLESPTAMQSITFANADELIDSMDGNHIQFTIPKAGITSLAPEFGCIR